MPQKGRLANFFSEKYYQYELQTALYMLEPWEKALFSKFQFLIYAHILICVDTIVLSIVSLSAITMYQYIPILFKLLH